MRLLSENLKEWRDKKVRSTRPVSLSIRMSDQVAEGAAQGGGLTTIRHTTFSFWKYDQVLGNNEFCSADERMKDKDELRVSSTRIAWIGRGLGSGTQVCFDFLTL